MTLLLRHVVACGVSPQGSPRPDTIGRDLRDAQTVRLDLRLDGALPRDSGAPDRAAPPPSCTVTICMAGAVTRDDGGNPWLADLCRNQPGVVTDCDPSTSTCYPMFSMFGLSRAHDALVRALDANGDGVVDEADPACEVRVVGYSWGGVNAVSLAEDFLGDAHVAPARQRVDRLVAIDPYAPLRSVAVPRGVKRFWEYRHSHSPPDDCSADVPLGPYKGIQPTCESTVTCMDYDYSLAPTTSFNGYLGSEVGHCTVVKACTPAVLHNLALGTDFPGTPPSVPVSTL